MKELLLNYKTSAEDSTNGWQNESLPIGNGYFGANIFGIVQRERIQITENSLQNPGNLGGLNNFLEIYLEFDHQDTSGYERGLSLNNAIAYCCYDCDGVHYEREYFASYPDKIIAVRLTASKVGALSFVLCPDIPYLKNYAMEPGDDGGKTGEVTSVGDTIQIKGKMLYYPIRFEGQIKVITETGNIEAENGTIRVTGADSAILIFTAGTNYNLDSGIFLETDPKKKLSDIDPHLKVSKTISDVSGMDYALLKERHITDYSNLFGRVSLEIDGEHPGLPTDELLQKYRDGAAIPYLEVLFFQYGRYLLIASSRDGGLPSNLQGIWNCHDQSPWGSGYWHNINVQMNYWPVFNTNLQELFKPYQDFNEAFRPCAELMASKYIETYNPENRSEEQGGCGWTIGTSSYPYKISAPGGHSGPGTGGLTTKLFWDYYDFTRDETILRNVTYPALHSMSRFLTRTVKNYEGKYLASFSASPEQIINGKWRSNPQYYHTVGCAFDQQMLYENGADLLKAAKLLGEKDHTVDVQSEQIDNYTPVEIGWSGQIKEYSEENLYGEIGEYKHRHISHLVALFPGTQINSDTPAWLDAAKFALNERGDDSTGWGVAHRLNAWARTGEGDRAYTLLRILLEKKTMMNMWSFLWSRKPVFQIDANFGGAAGVAEMLLQSHETYIAILPAIPREWGSGSYSGLVARGNFEVSAEWKDGCLVRIEILSRSGGPCKLKCKNISTAVLMDESDGILHFATETFDKISFETEVGMNYILTGIKPYETAEAPDRLQADKKTLLLSWCGSPELLYNVYRAVDNQPGYDIIATGLSGTSYIDKDFDFSPYDHVTYKVPASFKDGTGESVGVLVSLNHASELYLDRYRYRITQINL
ncbi:glycosyl hydrolase family 95 catalytic domain-containing protein [Paenibacillus ginsengarvi]|uniref:Glycoside hydrolase family 95 protein n=1 Tax=Paenibacillus ginsengarvi TaxID=400777 RepID=A0A3B0CIK1_9BACL|nr:glycoside hydrolase N-terminal domain-containing protein [Paenibacillus ginsengarvi]RKN84538.1 glycoside hydrolase family 95 protein [Paenibacillus ginsengarvi]